MATFPGRDIVVIAASAGGLAPLRTVVAGLPADLPAAILVVLHVPATGGRMLPRILDRAGPLPAAGAVDGEKLRPGRVYVAPADRHLIVANGQMRLSRGPRQNGVRPAADPLFRSAALHGGPRTLAVVLSGALDDGALGCATVERRGGRVAVQDPAEAEYESMPRSALAATQHPITERARKLSAVINRLVREEFETPPMEPADDVEAELKGLLAADLHTDTSARRDTGFTCPDCNGPLYYAQEDKAETYDCLVGHRWSPRSLLEEQASAVERALWLAIRSLDERGRLTQELAEAARQRGYRLTADRFTGAAREAWLAAAAVRTLANGMSTAGPGELSEMELGGQTRSP